MQHFGTNITIDGRSLGADQHRYEDEVARQLDQLLLFRTGQAVIAEIWRQRRHRLRIVPWRLPRHNASAGATDFRAATPRGAPVRDGDDGHHDPRWGHGTGRGSDSRLRYSPFMFVSDMGGGWSASAEAAWRNISAQLPPAPGDDRGEMLLHEMVHSLQQMTGTQTNDPMPSTSFDTVSEFNAVLVTNIYASERRRLLRAHHHGFTPTLNPTAAWTDPMFVTRINEFRKRLPNLVVALARIDTDFNPFRPPPPSVRSWLAGPGRTAPGATGGHIGF
jgi:Effector protein